MEFDCLLKILRDNSDKKFDEFNSKIINSSVPAIGCKVPFLRKLAKNFKNIEDIVDFPSNCYVEVDILKGIVISSAKLPFEYKSKFLRLYAEEIENWAACDIAVVKVNAAEKSEYFDFFCSLLSSESVFVCRYGIVNLLSNYLDDEYIDRIFAELSVIKLFGQYYVDMAVAWLIATAMVKCRNQTVKFMENEGKSVFNASSNNKALQKMRDSYRISLEDKQWTYSLKR